MDVIIGFFFGFIIMLTFFGIGAIVGYSVGKSSRDN